MTGECQAFRRKLGTKVIICKPADPEAKGLVSIDPTAAPTVGPKTNSTLSTSRAQRGAARVRLGDPRTVGRLSPRTGPNCVPIDLTATSRQP
jgi:hypothetical protein